MIHDSQVIARELLALGAFYGLEDAAFTNSIHSLDLTDYVEIVLGQRNLELVVGGVGKEHALIELAHSRGFPGEIVQVFGDFAARFPDRMLYTKLCFGPEASPPSMYFVSIEPWDAILAFLDTLPSIRGSLPALRAAVGDSAICFLIGFTLDPRTRRLLVKTYHLFDRQQAAPDPMPFLVSHRLTEGRLLPTTKRYTVNVPWNSLHIDPRWTAIADQAQSLFGDSYALMRGESTPAADAADGMKAYVFRHDRRQGTSYQIRSYNYYADEAIRLLQAGDHPRAVASLDNAVDYAPDDIQTHERVSACYASMQRYTPAIEHGLRARELARGQGVRPTLPAARAQALELLDQELASGPSVRSYLARGGIHFEREDYDEALRDFTRAAELAPRSAEVYNALGGVHLRMGRFGQALEACTHARQLSLAVSDSNLNMAREMVRLTQEIDARPSPRLYHARGVLLYHLGLLEAARDDFARSAKDSPTDAQDVMTAASTESREPSRQPAATAAKKYLFLPMSSHGYVFPSIKLAHILQQRSQDVLFAASTDYGALLQAQGLDSIRLYNQKENRPFLFPGSWFSSDTVTHDVILLEQVIAKHEPDVIVTSPLALSGFMMAERHSIPVVVVGFGEYLFPSSEDDTDTERNWRLTEMARHYNECRGALNLPPVPVSSEDFALIGDQYFIRSIPEMDDGLAPPSKVSYAGGLYWEPAYRNHSLARFIASSKASSRPLGYIQIGRLFSDHEVWSALVDALRQLPMNFIVDLGRADYVNAELPDNFHSYSFVPLGAIADDIDVVICAGQSSTAISAILHGKQILCIPHSSDSRAFAAKLAAKQIAITIDDTATGLTRGSLQDCFDKFARGHCRDSVLRYQALFRDHESEDLLFEKMTSVLR